MPITLGKNAYGKNAVNLSKIIRHDDHHEFRQISVSVSLQGDFDQAHTLGDNTLIVATDTQKNTVYALAKDHFTDSIEAFGLFLANYFMDHRPHISQVTILIEEHAWTRMNFDGQVHPHAYVSGGNEKHTTTVVQDRAGVTVQSGLENLLILKTTDSGFEKFDRDQYTTLKETSDRIFATECDISWFWTRPDLDFTTQYASIRTDLLKTFAFHNSLSVQHTLYAMGEAVLQQNDDVREIFLAMPNKHHIPMNLEPFGLTNDNDIFVATSEPYGYITGTVVRS